MKGGPSARTIRRIERDLSGRGGILVAFSGGVDSAVVARLAQNALGDRAVAVTADSPTLPRSELRDARRLARLLGIRHVVVPHDELARERFCRNPPERCYLCRKGLARVLGDLARKEGLAAVADGVNYSDTLEHRPGIRAATEMGVLHPLMEHRVTKAGVRRLARALGLPVHDRPSSACLSSRVPYGERITPRKLELIERSERFLRRLGFRQVRVRAHEVPRPVKTGGRKGQRNTGPALLASLEVDADDVRRLLDPGLARKVARELRSLGFSHVAVDLEGYRPGSLDEFLA